LHVECEALRVPYSARLARAGSSRLEDLKPGPCSVCLGRKDRLMASGSGRMRPSSVDSDLAQQYLDALGLTGCSSFHVQTRGGWRPGWGDGPSLLTVAKALRGRYGLSLAGLQTARVVILDLDVGHDVQDSSSLPAAVPPWDPNRETFPEFLRHTGRKDSLRARMRRYVADRVFMWVEQLRTANIPLVAIGTPRGVHVVVRLPAALPVEEVHAFGRALRRKIDRHCCEPIEVFPTPAGRMCRLPITGSSRLLSVESGYENPAHAHRPQDIAAILALEPVSKAIVRRALRNAQLPNKEQVVHRSADKKPRHCDAKERDAAQLFGREFGNFIVRTFSDGMRRGESWECVRRWSFALRVGCGLSSDTAERLFQIWIEHDAHRARHTGSQAGRTALMESFGACLAHCDAGIKAGRLKPGRQGDPRLHAIVAYLQRIAQGDAAAVRPNLPSDRHRCGRRSIQRPLQLSSPDPVRRAIDEQRLARSERAQKAAERRWARYGEHTAANARRLSRDARLLRERQLP
jgi:hypothetical protein